MALALLKAQAYGFYRDEPMNFKAWQALALTITGANTDATYDIGNYSGTFWTAVGATQPGLSAIAILKDIQTRGESFLWARGTSLAGKAQVDASRSAVLAINSAASSGGAATETYTVTGLLTTDGILSVGQYVDGAGAAVGILSWGGATGQAAADNALAVVYNADPGANAKVRVAVLRTVTTPDAGTYQLAMNGTNTLIPDITFVSGDAPTALTLVLEWSLKDGHQPVKYTRAA